MVSVPFESNVEVEFDKLLSTIGPQKNVGSVNVITIQDKFLKSDQQVRQLLIQFKLVVIILILRYSISSR